MSTAVAEAKQLRFELFGGPMDGGFQRSAQSELYYEARNDEQVHFYRKLFDKFVYEGLVPRTPGMLVLDLRVGDRK